MKSKRIPINPNQCCDICVVSVFDSTFYMYPCMHAFHRDCIVAAIEDETKYKPKDPKVRVLIKKLREELKKINEL